MHALLGNTVSLRRCRRDAYTKTNRDWTKNLARYLQAVESGQLIDREQFVAEHREYADELQE